MSKAPTSDERDDVLLAARYGDLDSLKPFVNTFGGSALADVRDESQNTVLHMACANGHEDIVAYILPLLPPSSLAAQNSSGSTPLHWASLNEQLPTMKLLIDHPSGPRARLIDIKNNAGRTPLGEAEMGGWNEGAVWLVRMMDIDEDSEDAARGTVTDEAIGDDEGPEEPLEMHVEVQDAEGQISKMSLKSTDIGLEPGE